MITLLKLWWRSTLAYEQWKALTPLGRALLWLPSVLFVYTYLLLMLPLALIELTYNRSAHEVAGHRKLRRHLWKNMIL